MAGNTRHRRRRYAQGKQAVAECMRSGQKMPYRDLVEDGHIPGLLVHPDWYEPRHPQELPIDAADAIALWSPSPELSINEGEFNTLAEWETWVPTNCPATPENLRFRETTTLATAAAVDDRQFTLEDAVTYDIGTCFYVELDGGGWFVGQVGMTSQSPTFRLPSLAPMTGAAAIGNEVFIGIEGSSIPLLNGSWAIT